MRLRGILLAVSGVVLMAFGLLFLVGAGGQMRRVVIGVAALGLGAVATGFGVRSFKRAQLWSPEQLRAEILETARRKNGELAMSDIEARLGRRVRVVDPVLEQMILEGVAREGHADGGRYFVFPHLQPRLMVRFCRYCDAEFPISEERDSCPNCGGALETRVATRSLSEGKVFAMGDST
jgi:Zn finger protein HypA/HybF involved in hydrogenase expression